MSNSISLTAVSGTRSILNHDGLIATDDFLFDRSSFGRPITRNGKKKPTMLTPISVGEV